MSVVVCPGMHNSDLTQRFVLGLQSEARNTQTQKLSLLISPNQDHVVLSAFHLLQFLHEHLGCPQTATPVVFISFSAGVVGAIKAAWGWQLLGGKVKALIALDGWGVPLFGNFGIHRLSHDYFTHWSSVVLGSGEDNFYAEPQVPHLEMWRSPQTIEGWWVRSFAGKSRLRTRLSVAQFLIMLLELYAEI